MPYHEDMAGSDAGAKLIAFCPCGRSHWWGKGSLICTCGRIQEPQTEQEFTEYKLRHTEMLHRILKSEGLGPNIRIAR